MKQVIEYKTEAGKVPFREWVFSKKLDHKFRDRILVRMDQFSLGNLGDCKPVGQGVCEMRLHFGPGYRIYYGQSGDELVILLCGGDKASQKKDIKRAYQYWLDYLRRTLK